MSKVVEPNILINDIDISRQKEEMIKSSYIGSESVPVKSGFDWSLVSIPFIPPAGDFISGGDDFLPKPITTTFIFTKDYTEVNESGLVKSYKKGDTIKLATTRGGVTSKWRELIDKGILLSSLDYSKLQIRNEFEKSFPLMAKSLVTKTKEVETLSDKSKGLFFKKPLTVITNETYRGVLLNDGRFHVHELGGGNIILEKGEYELIGESGKAENVFDLKNNKKLVNGLLIVAGAVILYKVIKK